MWKDGATLFANWPYVYWAAIAEWLANAQLQCLAAHRSLIQG
jgi:hypothetical protein